MRIAYCDHHQVQLPAKHRFPMGKYAALRELLLREQIVSPSQLIAADPADLDLVLAVHDPAYVHAFLDGSLDAAAVRRLGFPWSPSMVRRSLASVGSTMLAVESALEFGRGASLAGGTHHAHRDFGSGYCAFNDLAIAARWLIDRRHARRVLIVDVDVHQGDGTAAIFADDPQVFTCSLHGERNFPSRKPPSDLDVPLADGTDDAAYLTALDRALDEAMDRGSPDFVLYQGGVDVLAADKLGRLALTEAGARERDRRCFDRFRDAGLRFATTLGGGYANPIDATVAAYANTLRELTK